MHREIGILLFIACLLGTGLIYLSYIQSEEQLHTLTFLEEPADGKSEAP